MELHLYNFAGIVVGCSISTDNITPANATIGRFKVNSLQEFPFMDILDGSRQCTIF